MTLNDLAHAIGHLATDAPVQQLLEALNKKAPKSITTEMKHVESAKLGVSLGFDRELLAPGYAPRPLTKSSDAPYLHSVWLSDKWKGELPHGLRPRADADTLRAALGEPTAVRQPLGVEEWTVPLDDGRELRFEAGASVVLSLRQATRIADDSPSTRLLTAWLASTDRLDPAAVPQRLLQGLKDRTVVPWQLEDLLHRGLWSTHVRSELYPLRAYVRRLPGGPGWLKADLIAAFGERTDPVTKHAVPDLPERVGWDAVDAVADLLQTRLS